MKLSKTSWIILIAGVFVVAFASLGIARAQQAQEQEQVHSELTMVEKRLSQFDLKELSSQKTEKEEQLDQALAQLELARANINYPLESIEETDILFQIADDCGVTITDITSSNIGQEKLENISCSALTITARVSGNVADLIRFVVKLNSDFTTGVVKSANIQIPEDKIADEEKPSASIQMVIYSYQEG